MAVKIKKKKQKQTKQLEQPTQQQVTFDELVQQVKLITHHLQKTVGTQTTVINTLTAMGKKVDAIESRVIALENQLKKKSKH